MARTYDPQVASALATGQPAPEDVAQFDSAAAWLAEGTPSLDTVPLPLALAAIEAAIRVQAVERLLALDSAPKALRKAARAGLHRLKAGGVDVRQPARRAASFTLGREQINVPPRAFLTPADLHGYAQFVLGVTDDEGSCVLMGAFGGPEGFREVNHGHVSRSSLRKLIDEVNEQIPLMIEVPFDEALHHILPSVDRYAQLHGGAPHDWAHFSEHLDAATLDAARLVDPIGALPETPDPEHLESTLALATHPWFSFWPVTESTVGDALGVLFEAVAGPAPAESDDDAAEPSPDAPGQEERMNAALAELAGRVLDDPEVRAEWQRRVGLSATLARGAEDTRVLELSRHLMAALRGDTDPASIGLTQGALQSRLASMAMDSQGLDAE
ncbi:MAG: hypothetical protein H6739_21180 [Alphaproteobacteria bacterium]|nr:hypothetical protein [Alphaproteobacteria bacterium]